MFFSGQIIIGTITDIHNNFNEGAINETTVHQLVFDTVNEKFMPTNEIEDILMKLHTDVNIILFSSTFPLSADEFMGLPRICEKEHIQCPNCLLTSDLLCAKTGIETDFKKLEIQPEKTGTSQSERIRFLEAESEKSKTTMAVAMAIIKDQSEKITALETKLEGLMKVTANLATNLQSVTQRLEESTKALSLAA